MSDESTWTPEERWAAMLPCTEFIEIATDYLEGRMAPESRTRFEGHMRLCPGCDAYLDQMRQTIRIAGKLPEDTGLPPEARSKLLSAFRGWMAAPGPGAPGAPGGV